jgi:ATP-dependent exoDNAse (exonuclease V) beta subunit
VVVLADPTCRAVRELPSHHVDPERRLWAEPLCGAAPRELCDHAADELRRDQAEAVRVAYVAATRARDLLVVPGVGDEEVPGWLDALGPAIWPNPAERRRAAPAPGCPPFGDDSVLQRPPKSGRAPDQSVRPGLHFARAGNRVTWWDPRALELDRELSIGLRQDKLLQVDDSGAAADAGIRAHAEWVAERERASTAAAAPSLVVRTATALAHASGAEREADDVELHRIAERIARPGGARFGTLVHAVLASVTLDADDDAVARAARRCGRLCDASPDEIAAAIPVVAGALRHPLLRRAADAAELRRETPVAHRLADGTLVEGVVDLAFREDHGRRAAWTVIDFKTDRELGDRLPAYRRQVALYAAAIGAATGRPAHGALLVV